MTSENLIGNTIGGCEIVSMVGKGGMGVVYRARQLSLDRIVAVKVLSHRYSDNPAFTKRFVREARAIARITHPNILAVYDVGTHDDDLHYMIMELVDGRSLSQILEDRGRLPVREAADIVRQASAGLDCTARAGIVHRDVKPDNILLTPDGQVKISDFGLAKEMDSSVTATDAVMGTPAFMSPEQCDGMKLDHRSDIYCLGATFFRMVTGRLPFNAETAMAMMYRHKHEPLTPPSLLEPALGEAYNAIIVRMMAKRPESRFQSFAEVVAALDAAAKDEGLLQEDSQAASVPPPAQSPQDTALPQARDWKPLPPEERGQETAETDQVSHTWRPFTESHRVSSSSVIMRDDAEVNETVRQLRCAAEELAVEGRYSEAVRDLRKALQMKPSDDRVRTLLRDVEERMKARRQAVNEIRRCIQLHQIEDAVRLWDELPDDLREETLGTQIEQFRRVTIPAARGVELARSRLEAGQLDEAIRSYRRVLEFDPENEAARQGEREAQTLQDRVNRMLREAHDHLVQQRYPQAIETWQQILSIVPAHPLARSQILEARLLYGQELRNREDGPNRAQEQWKAILQIDPDHEEALQRLEADRMMALELQTQLDNGSRASREGRLRAARKALNEALAIDPLNGRAHQLLQIVYRRRRRYWTAAAVGMVVVGTLAILATLFVQDFLLLDTARGLVSEGRYDEALQALNKRQPTLLSNQVEEVRVDAQYRQAFREGMNAYESRDWDAARAAFNRAIEIKPEKEDVVDGQKRAVELKESLERISHWEQDSARWRNPSDWRELATNLQALVVRATNLATDRLPEDQRKRLLEQLGFYEHFLLALRSYERGGTDHRQMALQSWRRARGCYAHPQAARIDSFFLPEQ